MASKTILIVDGDVTSLAAMRRELPEQAFTVDEAHDGADALRKPTGTTTTMSLSIWEFR